MIGSAAIASLIAVALALVLALRAVRSHRLGSRTMVLMALGWIALIAVLAGVLQRLMT